MASTSVDATQKARVEEFARAGLVLLIVPVVVLVLIVLRSHQELFIPFYMALVVTLGAFCWKRLPQSSFKVFCLYVLGFALFNGFRTYADNTGVPVNYNYPVDLDISLFGTAPTVWLQDHLFVPGRISLLDRAAVAVYLTYFVAHFVVGGYLLAFRRDLLLQHAGTITVTLCVGLALYFLLPTAPPWMAAQSGQLPHIFRITQDVTNNVSSDLYAQGASVAGTNDVAAMPSLHTALTAVVAMSLWRLNRIAGVVGWLYVAAMGFSLVYLGEHYFTDVIAGVILAIVCWHLVRRLTARDAFAALIARREATPTLGLAEPHRK